MTARSTLLTQTRTKSLFMILGQRERRLDSIDMARDEGKIATGRFHINTVGAREGSSFSCKLNNAINKGKLACSHPSLIK